jgi:hypothetical protein
LVSFDITAVGGGDDSCVSFNVGIGDAGGFSFVGGFVRSKRSAI